MTVSFFVRKTLTLVSALTLAMPAIVFGQVVYRTNSSEYSIAGSLPGDQVHPQLSVNGLGGYLVWQDNISGIGAVPLDSSFSRTPRPFPVNRLRSGNQEWPQVALLKSGGAVFVWQSGPSGLQDVHARFLSITNTWLSDDILVNSFTRNAQIQPRIAVLGDGNVAIVWGSFNQSSSSSMQDVFGQMFSPAGQKLGSEFPVNQFIAYNQRTPAIAALASGGFVVVWVSEMERSGTIDNINPGFLYSPTNRPSVEIYARLYDQNASPLTGEVLVNTSDNVCANPSVAAAADGGFMVAWGEKDLRNRSNSWDIVARPFSASGAGQASRYVNTEFYGDQYAPQIASSGSDYLIVWTSLGQDGSREGVYGQFLHGDGSLIGGEFRVNTTTLGSQMHPAVASDGYGRFLAVWTSYTRGVNSMDLFAQTYVAPDFVPGASGNAFYGAPPPEDPISDPSVGGSTNAPPGLPSAAPILAFPPALFSGDILPNGFALAKGSYNGLLYDTNGVAPVSSGYFTAKTTERGAYTAKLILAGRSYSLSGQFDATGRATNNISRAGLSALRVELQLDLAGGDQIRGRASDVQWSAQLLADRVVFSGASHPAPQVGSYTFVIPGDPQSTTRPGGDSYGTVKVDSSGKILLAAALADGAKVTQSSAVSKAGVWPLYSSLYSSKGELASWIQFVNKSDSDLGGQLIWIKPAGASAIYYPGGFTNEVSAMGSLYRAPVAGARALNITAGHLVLRGGGLHQSITNALTLGLNNKVTGTGNAKLTLAIARSSGLFKGSVLNPETGKATPFQGVLFKKGNVGMGYFLGSGQSGEAYLCPAP